MTVGMIRLALGVGGAAVVLGAMGMRPSADPAVGNSCAAISPQSLGAYGKTIDAALRWAEADAAKHGSTGAYAVAARNSRDQLKRARDRAAAAAADLRSDPSVTTPAEAGTVKEHVRFILELVPQAAHWAIISEIYHKSTDARRAFEGSVTVLVEGNQVFAESARCYMEL
jgi:hypothetical protein